MVAGTCWKAVVCVLYAGAVCGESLIEDRSISLDERVNAAIAAMTLEEKVEQLNIHPDSSKKTKGTGQRSQLPNSRLGIGPILATNGPRGPRPSGDRPVNRTEGSAPVAPTALCIAATWNEELQAAIGRQWGLLTKEYGLNAIWAPGINIIKDPRAGRCAEYTGEDPFLSGKTGAALVRGIQSAGVAACAKHYLANNWESGRGTHDVTVPDRALHEMYLPPFRMCVEEADVWMIMTCYNKVNGVWGSASRYNLEGLARKECGFGGIFISDWGAQMGSAAQAVLSGQNLELPGNLQLGVEKIREALDKGELSMDDVDRRLREILRVKLGKIGYFGDETPSGYVPEEYKKTIYQAGVEGAVLLKNDRNLLPLSPQKSVALIGPFANNKDLMVGNQGSSSVAYSYAVTVRKALQDQVRLTYAKGCDASGYAKAKAGTALPCHIEYFNGHDFQGPPVYSLDAAVLDIPVMLSENAVAENAEGRRGKGLHTDGGQAMSLGNTPDGDSWTVALWIRPDDQFPAAPRCLLFLYDREGSVSVEGGAIVQRRNGKTVAEKKLGWRDMNGTWIPLVLIRQGAKLTVYRSGREVCALDVGKEFPPQAILAGANKMHRQALPVNMDDLMMWDRALSPEQVQMFSEGDYARLGKPVVTQDFENPAEVIGRIPGIRNDRQMSVRVAAKFKPERAGKYEFRVESGGGVRIRMDGRLIYDLWDEQIHAGKDQMFWHVFEDVKEHDIVVEYASLGPRYPGSLRLEYVAPPASLENLFAGACDAARQSDVAVVCVGVDQEGMQGEAKDRATFALPGWQDELIRIVRAVNSNTVVVLFSEGGCDVQPWIETVPAVMEVYHPGSEGGNIVADLLLGKENPSGRLTITWPKRESDLPFTGPVTVYSDNPNEFGYRWFADRKISPRFPFGYGLSYTTFDYSGLKVAKTDDPLYPYKATLTVRNTGHRPGKEVAQIYVHQIKSAVIQPVLELAGFSKVSLQPGEARTVDIPLGRDAFRYYDTREGRWIAEPGDYEIMASPDAISPKMRVKLEVR